MEDERLKAILEALLFAAGEPVSLARLTAALDDVPREIIKDALAGMAAAYSGGARGIVLEEVGGGYQFRTAREHAPHVRKLLAAKPPRLSRPLLETLAIVAYRQPITRPEIEQLRGVDSGGVLDTLLERHLIRIAGRKEAPGRPSIFATTPEFLETFGLKDLANLPDLDEFREIQGVSGLLEGAEAAAPQYERMGESNASAEPDSSASDEAALETARAEEAAGKPAEPDSQDESNALGDGEENPR
ncbi:MAG: SMC-Scp complex subunit ScpB [Candidatus Binataceae bacterium]